VPTEPRLDDAALVRRTRLRLVAWSGGLTLLLIVLLGGAVYWAVAGSLESRGTSLLADRATEIARSLGRGGRMSGLGMVFGGRTSGTVALIVAPDGSPMGDVQVNVTGLPDQAGVAAARVAASATDVRNVTLADTPVRVYSLALSRGGQTYVVQVVGERESEVDLLATLLTILAVGGLVAVALASAVGFLYAGRALVPIRASMARRDAALARQRDFAANASHELRSPLAVIRTSATALRRGGAASDPEATETLDDITASVDHLAVLVDDLLLLARTDSGAVEIERTRVDLADVAVEASGALAPTAATRGVQVIVDPLPAEVDGDPVRLRQLVTILVDNAVAHSPAGSTVAVRVRAEARVADGPDGPGGPGVTGASGAVAVLAVEDQGPGIRPEDLPRVFERFWRADDAPAGGTGLGLAIAAWITERHGGTIRVENRDEGGARFLARIPLAAPPVARG
jgi:two-component system, OmpR family, sensor histidine kinase CiaH